jgi:hypothetical protein
MAVDGSNYVLQNSTRWDSKHIVMQQEKFSSQGWLRVIIELSAKPGGWFLFFTLQATCNNKQTNSSASLTKCGSCQAPTARKINKTKEKSENKVFVIFKYKELKVKPSKSN